MMNTQSTLKLKNKKKEIPFEHQIHMHKKMQIFFFHTNFFSIFRFVHLLCLLLVFII